MQADDVDSVARLVTALAFTTYQRGMVATTERWFGSGRRARGRRGYRRSPCWLPWSLRSPGRRLTPNAGPGPLSTERWSRPCPTEACRSSRG